MCGIAGTFVFDGPRELERDTLVRMLDAIRHRGPDDEGMHAEPGLAIGMRRLSIIDLAGGNQPIWNEDGTVAVVFNGEIYNYRELRKRLIATGHELRTASDTEVIVHLYEEHGERFVDELRGMFGVAVWDARRRRLVLARDRLGIKPLYWHEAGGRLVFGSEIKAMLEHPSVPRALDHEALAAFLALKYVPSPATLFRGIRSLPPAHLAVVDAGGARLERYWDVSFAGAESDRRSEAACAEELEELLRDCVSSHLVSDVPFGAFLSGGLDSSSVVALMSSVLDEPVRTYAVGYAPPWDAVSELPYARLVAERYGTDHHEVLVGPEDVRAGAERVAWHLDQPIADEATLPVLLLAELAARDVKMVLSGEGGDELFAGYARYSGERLSPLFTRLPGWSSRALRAGSRSLPGLRRPKLALEALTERDVPARLVSWFALAHDDLLAELTAGTLARAHATGPARRAFAGELARADGDDTLGRMLYVDTKLWLPDDLLARNDKLTMAASLEARVPLLDHHLVEFAASLPSRLKLRGLTRKYLLRRVVEPLLPPEVVQRRKKGFPVPLASWLRAELRPWIGELLSPEVVRARGLFDPDATAQLLEDHASGRSDSSSLLWGLAGLELWHRAYLDAPARHGG